MVIFTYQEIDKTNPIQIIILFANKCNAQLEKTNNVNSGTFDIDLLSDGFKIRTNVGEINEGGSLVDYTSTVPGQKHHHLTCMVDSPTQDNLNN